ncbi:Coatomer subunit gamma [Balamuthia mandrillaris]
MNSFQDKKDDDEMHIPFQNLDKGIVLQEKRMFNETPLVPRKCYHLLTKILYLLAQSENLTTQEATDLFFSVTKLFQSKDVPLRRMLYLVLKELLPLAEDVIIVISSLTKDMNSKVDVYKANAVRVLCKINDISMLSQAERYLKQAIVDKEGYVASAALVSGVHLMRASPSGVDTVKRWFSEIQSALKSKSVMVQYHALGLLHHIRRHDRLAISKLVSEMTRNPIRSNYAHCLLIRFACQVMEDEPDPTERGRLYDYLEGCLRHKSEMVSYEAARCICELRNVTAKELTSSISVLQMYLSSPKATLRFAAVRTLNKVAMTHPLAVTACNLDMENLIGDVNRSIATLAITTLLKTGSEASVDRLMQQISNFMGEISDEFKIVVVDAIKTLCLKYPQKHRTLMNFLSNMLRDEGGFEYKKAIIDAVLTIINALPDSKEAGLSHLCEFIEDCEFTQLSTKILHLLGNEGPNTSCPSKYIRYIYNRVFLENANVRASSVGALAKFGVALPDLRPSIIVLLQRCLHDNDDEVRDRATFYLTVLEKDQALAQQLILDGLAVPLENLEQGLKVYIKNPSDTPFDISMVPTTPLEKEDEKPAASPELGSARRTIGEDYDEALNAIPHFTKLGARFHSTKPAELTESETEYVVNCVKHIYANHIVFQFNCTNTLPDQLLEKVSVRMETTNPEFTPEFEIPAPKLIFQSPGVCYTCISHPSNSFPVGTFTNTLKFIVKDVDANTQEADDESGYEDEYQLEDSEVTVSDYMKPTFETAFKEQWEALGDECEVVEKFSLSTMKTIKEAVTEIIGFLGMQPCDSTDSVPAKRNKHILLLSGTFLGGIKVLVRVRMVRMPDAGVNMELTVRSTDHSVSTAVAGAF